MHLSQTELGAKLRYSAMAVSRWERGALEPTAEVYIQFGNLAGEPECWFFWERAGLRKSDIFRLAPEAPRQVLPTPLPIEIVSAGGMKKSPAKASRLFAIPVLDVNASGPSEDGDRITDFTRLPANQLIAANADWCPNPLYTSFLRVQGNSMYPLINNGDTVAIDYSQSSAGELNGKIVIASHKKRGLTIARFRKYREIELLEPENREYDPIQINNDRNWKIVGRALWWIRRAP